VDPGVGAAGGDQGDLLPGEALQGIFQDLLKGNLAPLALPAVIAAAVVFQEQAEVADGSNSFKIW
jgi:hypothetical protein